ncbi:MAG: GAF domain-containing protein [Calothrix sp. MO_192.B10]|nr:GAF domain-containing protein [Calothrix sp. MO_192.B10]
MQSPLTSTDNQINELIRLPEQLQQQKTLASVIKNIRESLDLDTIFQTTVTQVREQLNADRAAVFQFYPGKDWEGEFTYEDIASGWDSVVSYKAYDSSFKEQFVAQYQQGRIQAVTDIYNAGLNDYHVEILGQLQIRANLVVPLLKDEKLWGLLCIHQCQEIRDWQDSEIEFLQIIADHLMLAIRHSEVLKQAQNQTERQKALTGVITRIRESLDLDVICQTTVVEVRQLLQADRVGIFRFDPENDWEGEFLYEDVAEGWSSAIAKKVYDHCFSEDFAPLYAQGRVNAITDIYQQESKDCYISILEQFQVRANVVAPLLQEGELWGLLCIHQCGNARNWQESEIEFVSLIAQQLGIALKQDAYVKQVQTQAIQLAEVTARDKAMERQKLLAATIDKIRKSLDIETIFKTTTQAVRELLAVERVSIYRFNADWRGKFVADSFKDGWQKSTFAPHTSLEDFGNNDDEQLPRNEIFVPISQGDNLWGLLIAYQYSHPRYWEEEEVNLLAQIAVQLGIAIQQAELLTQTQIQATELVQALQELKQAQAQLVQGEKMASLGELMAGIAHEINNPVNFIFGNIQCIKGYTEELLELIQLYRQNYTEPVSAVKQHIQEIDLDFIIADLPNIIESIKTGSERIASIVQSLGNFSRKNESEFKKVDIHEGLDSTLLILNHRLEATGDRPNIIVTKNYGNLPLLECYPALLNQVFMNILVNGIDALEQKFQDIKIKYLNSSTACPLIPLNIWIKTQATDQEIIIRISDGGLGMSEEICQRIFDPFFTTKEVGQGTGLGLSISYKIVVEKHKGTIQCLSKPGQGTEFIIQIPIKNFV